MKQIRFIRKEKGAKRFNLKLLLFFSLVISVLLQIFLTLQGLGTGGEISRLEKESEEVVSENRRLQRELVAKTSLNDLSKKAGELGFINQELPFYIKVEDLKAQALR